MRNESAADPTPAPRSPAAAALVDGIGRRVAAHRERRGLRVAEFAREVGVSPSLISQIERGQARPSVSTLFAMAQALDVPVDAFFREQPGAPAAARAGAKPVPEGDPDGAPGGAPDGRQGHGERPYVVRRADRAAIDI